MLSVVSLDEVREVWERNVFGVIAVTQAMLPLLREAPAARVVNISSGGGSLAGNMNPDSPHRRMFGNYSASKSALNAITVGFALDLESEGIKVNATDPGVTKTDLNNNQGTGTVEDAAVSRCAERCSARMGRPARSPTITGRFHGDLAVTADRRDREGFTSRFTRQRPGG